MNKKLIIGLITIISISIISIILYFILKKPSTSSTCNKNCINGKCDSNNVCICDTGYLGADCSTKCSCVSFNNGICNDDGTCTCKPQFTGLDCKNCINPLFNGDKCDQCVNTLKTFSSYCVNCTNPIFTGDKCDQCVDPVFTGPKCVNCTNPTIFTGPKCDQCVNPVFTGPKCDQCNTFYIADGKGSCKPDFSKDVNNCYLTFNFVKSQTYKISTSTSSNIINYSYSTENNGFVPQFASVNLILWDHIADILTENSKTSNFIYDYNNIITKVSYKYNGNPQGPIVFDIINIDNNNTLGTAEVSLTHPKPYIVFYDGTNNTGNEQYLPWDKNNIYSSNIDCVRHDFVDINNFSPAPILFQNKPKSIGWSDDVDVKDIDLMFYVRGNFENGGDTDCGPSHLPYVIKSYSDITTSSSSSTSDPSWIWNNAFMTIGWSPNKDYFPNSIKY